MFNNFTPNRDDPLTVDMVVELGAEFHMLNLLGETREFCRYWGRKPRQKTWDSYSRWRNWLKKSRRSFEENRTGILVPFKNGHDAAPRHDDDFISRQLERQKQADAIRAAAASRLVQ